MKDDEPKLDTRHKFYSALGHCISRWANVDEALYEILALALCPYKKQAAIIYFNIPTLKVRMDLTNEIVLSRLPPATEGRHKRPGEVKWCKITSDFRGLAQVRNIMAHDPVMGRENTNIVMGGATTHVAWHEVRTSKFKPKKIENVLKQDDLEAHYEKAGVLLQAMRAFSEELPSLLP